MKLMQRDFLSNNNALGTIEDRRETVSIHDVL